MKKNFLLLIFLLVLASCARDSKSDRQGIPEDPEDSIAAPSNATVKIYFENTLSMDGYINGNTDFKDVFRDLLVAVDNENDIALETEFFLVNDQLIQTNFGVGNIKISEALSPRSTANKGNKGSSNFEEVLNTVLQNQEGDVISIVMADFIYSPQGESNTPSALNKLRTYTQDAFLKAAGQDENLITRVYSFTSDFNGTYFDIDNRHIQGVKTRPYYLFVIAPADLMAVFSNKIATQLKKAPGYNSEALFTSANFSSVPTQILTSTLNQGRIKSRANEIEVISYPRNGNLEFVLLTNFSALPVDNSYLLDKNNYQIENSDFSIKEVGEVKGKNLDFAEQGTIRMDPSALVSIEGNTFTHAILFESNGLASEDLEFSLKKKIPGWVKKVHSENDKQIKDDSLEQTKTFGFGHLVEGISNAYELKSGNDEFFKITIPVK